MKVIFTNIIMLTLYASLSFAMVREEQLPQPNVGVLRENLRGIFSRLRNMGENEVTAFFQANQPFFTRLFGREFNENINEEDIKRLPRERLQAIENQLRAFRADLKRLAYDMTDMQDNIYRQFEDPANKTIRNIGWILYFYILYRVISLTLVTFDIAVTLVFAIPEAIILLYFFSKLYNHCRIKSILSKEYDPAITLLWNKYYSLDKISYWAESALLEAQGNAHNARQ